MKTTGTSHRRSLFLDLTPLRESPAFARLYFGSLVSSIGHQVTIVTVSLEIFSRTQSTLMVGLVSAAALIPAILAGLYGGTLADAFDRRKVGIITAIVSWVATVGIAAHSWFDWHQLWLIYLFTAITASGFTIISTSKASIIPRLLPPHLIPAASALNGIEKGLMITVGPALAGVLVATIGYGPTYAVDVVLFTGIFLGLFTLPSITPQGKTSRPGFRSVLQGIRYLKKVPHVSAGFVLDIAAMTFGSPRVLLPAAGALVLGGGATTVGILMAAPAIGAIVCGLFSGRVGSVRRQGRALTMAVGVYGFTIFGFGLVLLLATGQAGVSEDTLGAPVFLVAAFLALLGAGISDEVSAIYRQTMLQTTVPDNVRGRMQGIFIVVVSGGPRVGDVYAGILATVLALWVPAVLGGLLIVSVVFMVVRVFRQLWWYDSKTVAIPEL